MARSTARKRALNTLFEADVKGKEITDMLDERLAYPGAQTPLPEYAIEIIRGVASHRRTIDKALGDVSESWEVKRMPAIDRNLARMGAWEIVYNDDTPAGVAINEAIALAKEYSDEDTPDFLYAILSEVEKKAQAIRDEEIEWQNQRAILSAQEASDQEAEIADNDSMRNHHDVAGTTEKSDIRDTYDPQTDIHLDDLSLDDFKDSSLGDSQEEISIHRN